MIISEPELLQTVLCCGWNKVWRLPYQKDNNQITNKYFTAVFIPVFFHNESTTKRKCRK